MLSRNAAALIACCTVLLMLPASPQAQQNFTLPPLPYAYNALEPVIDNQTMTFHHDRHHQTYITNLNNLIKGFENDPTLAALQTKELAELLHLVGTRELQLPLANATALRNNGGGAFNHAMFWKLMAQPGSSNTTLPDAANAKDDFAQAIVQAFGSVQAMIDQVTAAGTTTFGSGWAWVVYNRGKLSVLSTPNQDNPLMKYVPTNKGEHHKDRVPILCVDVWEHAYYLKYGPGRGTYLSAWWNVTNWVQVAENYEAAERKDYDRIVGANANQRS